MIIPVGSWTPFRILDLPRAVPPSVVPFKRSRTRGDAFRTRLPDDSGSARGSSGSGSSVLFSIGGDTGGVTKLSSGERGARGGIGVGVRFAGGAAGGQFLDGKDSGSSMRLLVGRSSKTRLCLTPIVRKSGQ